MDLLLFTLLSSIFRLVFVIYSLLSSIFRLFIALQSYNFYLSQPRIACGLSSFFDIEIKEKDC